MLVSKKLMVMVAGLGLCVSQVALAAPLHGATPVRSLMGVKNIKFHLRNDTKEPLQLMVGTTPMTVAPGATVAVQGPVGAKIVMAQATTSHAAGEQLAEIGTNLSDATLGVR